MIVLESIFGDFFRKKAKCFLKEKGSKSVFEDKKGISPSRKKADKVFPGGNGILF